MQLFSVFTRLVILVVLFENSFVAGTFIPQSELCEDSERLLVNLPCGKILGKDNGYYYSYESIPYAEPPVGRLRYEAPKPYNRSWSDIYDGRTKSPACMQWFELAEGEDKLVGQEDCLTVSVYRPNSNEMLPVVVLIHGGAFMFGSVNAFEHELLMRSAKFVVVKIAYRLGPLGFLSTQDSVIAGNFGLKDQRLALQWIKQNIANFNGDPNSIVVTGFSAGGASVHMHLLHEDSRELMNAAFSCSGSALSPWVFPHNARERAFQVAAEVQCDKKDTSQDVKTCLQITPAEKIVRTVPKFLVLAYNPFTTFGAVVEHESVADAFINKPIKEIIRSGKVANVPWLVSYVTEDGGYNAAELLSLDTNGIELIEQLNEKWMEFAPAAFYFDNDSIEKQQKSALKLRDEYMDKNAHFSATTYANVERMYTNIMFKNGAEEAVRLHKEIPKGAPVYAYCYDNAADLGYGQALSHRKDLKFGTVHGDDFFLIFPRPFCKKEMRDDLKSNSNKFIAMLENFAKTGELKFGSCQFKDNVGETLHQLMSIKGNSCENHPLDVFP